MYHKISNKDNFETENLVQDDKKIKLKSISIPFHVLILVILDSCCNSSSAKAACAKFSSDKFFLGAKRSSKCSCEIKHDELISDRAE